MIGGQARPNKGHRYTNRCRYGKDEVLRRRLTHGGSRTERLRRSGWTKAWLGISSQNPEVKSGPMR